MSIISKQKNSIALQNASLYSVVLFAISSYIFGGGPSDGGVSFIVICLSASLMLYFSMQGDAWKNFKSLALVHRLALFAPLVLLVFQILPLPWINNSELGVSGARNQIFDYAGIASSWVPISISPIDTFRAAIITCSMIVFAVCVMNLQTEEIYKLVKFIILAILLSVIIGSLQFLVRSPILKFYKISHDASLIGFFANKNHMALVIACVSLMAYVQIMRISSVGKGALLLGLFAICAMLELATNSRAGLFLMFIAAIFMSMRHWHKRRYMIVLTTFCVGLLSVGSINFIKPVSVMWDRIGGATEDGRWIIFERSTQLIDYVWPMGSGVGTFSKVFNAFEKLEWVTPLYVNSAHNDYIEYVVEGGIFSVIVMGMMFLSLFIAISRLDIKSIFGASKRPDDLVFVSITIILLFMLHSVVDYPLRRPASALIFFLGLGVTYRALTLRGRTI